MCIDDCNIDHRTVEGGQKDALLSRANIKKKYVGKKFYSKLLKGLNETKNKIDLQSMAPTQPGIDIKKVGGMAQNIEIALSIYDLCLPQLLRSFLPAFSSRCKTA